MVKQHDLLWPFDDFLPLAYRTLEFAGHKHVSLRQTWSDKQRYIRYKTLASCLMAFTIRKWLFLTDMCVIYRKWQWKTWTKWHKVSWAIKFLQNAFWRSTRGETWDRLASSSAVYCKPTLSLLKNCEKSSCAEIMRKIFCFKCRTHLPEWRFVRFHILTSRRENVNWTPVKLYMAMVVLVWYFRILLEFKRNYFNLLWILKVLTASLTMFILKVNIKKGLFNSR